MITILNNMTWKQTIPNLWDQLRSHLIEKKKEPKQELPSSSQYSKWFLAGETKPYLYWEEDN
jgi:hypothetical protein